MKNHPTDKCFKLLDHVKAKAEASRWVNQMEPEKEEDQYVEEEFYEENTEPISAIFSRRQSHSQSKNYKVMATLNNTEHATWYREQQS